ncbi:MAG: septum formation protein Maf [Candidatus Aenigmarchaeota archaeon]|nr:septum formation protein Maf [Candidatus Aenigmarchaeota archaeon]
MKLVLASESPRRRKLLEQLGLSFEVIPSNIDEDSVKEGDPKKLVQRLAELKARAVASRLKEDALVIAADTVVLFDGRIFGKPKDADDARRILRMLSGRKHEVYTGVCMINTADESVHRNMQVTEVEFRELRPEDIEFCIRIPATFTGAGAYVPETWSVLFSGISGSYTNVLGLPMEKLIPMLRSHGITF